MVLLSALDHRRVGYLDGWRGLAILFVLAGHFSPFGQLGSFGVELFFVLSGRLMADILVGQRQPLGTFAARRIMRIVPALYVYVLLAAMMGALGGVPVGHVARSAAAAALFVSNYAIGTGLLTVFQHSWSLAVEEHSYLALALVVTVAKRDPARVARLAVGLAAAAMTAAAIRFLFGHASWQIYWHSEVRAASILLSFAAAIHAPRLAAGIPRVLLPWASPAAFAGGLLLAAADVPITLFCTVGTGLLAAGVNLVDHAHERVRRLLQDPILRWFGITSFSLYLWQQPLHAAYVTGLGPMIAFPLALLLGAASFYLVETPARRLLRRSPSAAAPATA
jgi:peptidoglycan/LPS O-acetylase OafA/YrhL